MPNTTTNHANQIMQIKSIRRMPGRRLGTEGLGTRPLKTIVKRRNGYSYPNCASLVLISQKQKKANTKKRISLGW